MPMQPIEPCWVIHDGSAGNRRQATALAAALKLPFREWTLQARAPHRWLAPRKLPGHERALDDGFSDALAGSLPALAIGCGRLAALATRLAGEAGIRSIQILNPHIDPRHWDLVIAPVHDRLRGENVVAMLGSLSPVDAAWLEQARRTMPRIGEMPAPRTAVLLGGPTPATRFDRAALEVLCSKLDRWLAVEGGSGLLCGSRRTPAAWAPLLRERYGGKDGLVWMDTIDGENPYPAVLGWADRIIVSPDSVNMVSEACATSVPVFVAEPERATGRVADFLASLLQMGRVQAQGPEPGWHHAIALAETERVAAAVRERLSLD